MVDNSHNSYFSKNSASVLQHEIEELEKRLSMGKGQSTGNSRAAQLYRSRLASRRQQLARVLAKQSREDS